MLSISKIKKLFKQLNQELAQKNIIGEIGICGGAVMCLVFNTRKATKDIDAIFEPTQEIREAAIKISKKNQLDKNWLNDAVKIFFFKDPPKEEVLNYSHLRIWAPRADYMLAMKAISARFDSHDKDDLIFLIEFLYLESSQETYEIINQYYPKEKIPAKTQFLIEEIFEKNIE